MAKNQANNQQPIIDNILAEHNLTLNKLLRFRPETQQQILENLTNENQQKLQQAIMQIEPPASPDPKTNANEQSDQQKLEEYIQNY